MKEHHSMYTCISMLGYCHAEALVSSHGFVDRHAPLTGEEHVYPIVEAFESCEGSSKALEGNRTHLHGHEHRFRKLAVESTNQ